MQRLEKEAEKNKKIKEAVCKTFTFLVAVVWAAL